MNSAAMSAASATDAPALRVYESPDDRRNAAVAANLDLVAKAARHYSRGREIDPDLYQAGAVALTEAIDPAAIDRKKLTLVVHYAIRREVYRTVAGVVELPHEANTLRIRINRARETLGTNATPQQVCKALGIAGAKRGRVARLMRLMDAANGNAELWSLAGADGRETERRFADWQALRQALMLMPRRQSIAVSVWFGIGAGEATAFSVRTLCYVLDCSPVAARQTLRRAIAKLRTIMEASNA